MPKNAIQVDIVSSKGKIAKTYASEDNIKNQTLSFYCKPDATASQIQAVATALEDVFKQSSGTASRIDATAQLLQQVEITGQN